MSEFFGAGASRTLDAIWRQFGPVVFQQSKPPLDSEVNLVGQVSAERLAQFVRTTVPSGFFTDPTRALGDFQFDRQDTNRFVFGNPRKDNANHAKDADEANPVVWANINGWILPVAGTHIGAAVGVENVVRLFPPPASDSRIDFVFLEAWATLVAPNPSTANKPTSSTIWKYGNVQFGGTNLVDDLEDPQVRFETTERVQIQYRLRVFGQGVGLGSSVALDVYPDALDDPNVLGQATSLTPVGGFQFSNMREALGDPSLWRAGDGDPTNALGTTDGYVYAIPVCAVFRRNSGVYMSVADAGSANQNGGFMRTPSTQVLPDPLTGARTLLVGALGAALAFDDENLSVAITNLNGSGLEDTNLALGSTFLVIDGEIIGIDAIDVGAETVHIPVGGRGRLATNPTAHAIGAVVDFHNVRPDGLYSDEIAARDLLDLRRTINTGDWDYSRLLEHNLAALTRGDLRTAWKQAGTTATEGVTVHEVDYLQADGSVPTPNGTEALDGPDGIRTVWSDGAVMQANVTVLLDDESTLIDNGIGFASADQFDTTTTWATGPDFLPIGWMNLGGVFTGQPWTNGSSIFMHIGGDTGEQGARGTFRDGTDREVRFVMPKEYFRAPTPNPADGNQYPITIRFIEERALDAKPWGELGVGGPSTAYPGPMYPWDGQSFEQPFIALGQVVATGLTVPGVDPSTFTQVNLDMTGTVSVSIGVSTVTGVDTFFTTEVAVGDYVLVNSVYMLVREVTSDTVLECAVLAPANAAGVVIKKLQWLVLDIGVDFDVAGSWWSLDANGNFANDPALVSNPLLNGRTTFYGALTKDGEDPTGGSSDLYAVTRGDKDSLGNNGAWKVLGAGSATAGMSPMNPGITSLALFPLSADFTGVDLATANLLTLEVRTPQHYSEIGGSYAGNTADLCIVLTDIGGDNNNGSPWQRTALNYPAGDATDISMPRDAGVDNKVGIASKLLVSTSLLYHPGRGGMARVHDDVVRVSLKDADSSYLRQSKAVIDTTFPNVPDDETVYDTSHVQLWNRLPGLGWHAPTAPDYGGNIVGFTEQDREHELFIDKGSKTLVFRPLRDREMTLQALTVDEYTLNGGSLLGLSYTYPDAHSKDNLQLFTRTGGDPSTGKRMGFALPREYMPRFGRQDIPYYTDVSAGSGTFLNGINHLFRDSTDLSSPVFNIVGGADNITAGNEVTPMFFRTSNLVGYGHGLSGANITASVVADFLEARKTTEINSANPFAQGIIDAINSVNSSDLGKGLKGIQLPPYYGISRLYGVYDARDYEAKGGSTFLVDRFTLEADPAPNLLKVGADQQTLFILEDGAKDLTTTDGDHTYIIPSEAIDISKAINYVDGDAFEDYDYVVECVVFGFSNGWITENNYVLVRAHNGSGALIADGADPQLEGVHMVIPTPAALNDGMFVAAQRTVYQGDPYMTRHQTTRVTSDYEYRYGRPDQSQLFEVGTPIQQYMADGTFVPETPNARAFEVLASLDFYTTLGTGNVGGALHPGTFMDVGSLETAASTRIPDSGTAPPWQVTTRAFTEGQKNNASRSEAIIHMVDNENLNPLAPGTTHARVEIIRLDGSVVPLEFSRDGNDASVTADAATNGIIRLDETGKTVTNNISSNISFTGGFTAGGINPGTLGTNTAAVPLPAAWNAVQGDMFLVQSEGDLSDDYGAVVFDAWISAPNLATVRGHYTFTGLAFEVLSDGLDPGNTRIASFAGLSIPAHTTSTVAFPWVGAVVGTDMPIVAAADAVVLPDGIILHAALDTAGSIKIHAVNTTAGAVVLPTIGIRVALLRNFDPLTHTFAVSVQPFVFTHIKSLGDVAITGQNLVSVINTHPDLITSVKAYQTSSQEVLLQAVTPGAAGNILRVGVTDVWLNTRGTEDLYVRRPSGSLVERKVTIGFSGAADNRVNGGDGTSQLRLTGMTERLPMGILLQDSDFLGENPLGDTATAMKTSPAGLRPLQTILPLTDGGEEYTRFLGAPGDLVGMADGAVLQYSGYNELTAMTGARTLRVYRGGSAFVVSGNNPGGPIDWVSETFSAPLLPVLKGGALVCRAMLVRNYYEEPFDTSFTVSQGDEIQMIVITHGVFGNATSQQDGIELSGIISPAGYGEGYAASDRYRIEGRPMFKGFSRATPDPEEVILAPFPDES